MYTVSARYIALCLALLTIALSLAISPAANNKSHDLPFLALDVGADTDNSTGTPDDEDAVDEPASSQAVINPITASPQRHTVFSDPVWVTAPQQIRPIRAPPTFA